MSLCMAFAQPGAAHLITDGAVWDEDHICIGMGRKVAMLPQFGLAVGYTGYGGHAEWIEKAIEETGAANQREAITRLPTALRSIVDGHGSRKPGRGLTLVAIVFDPSPATAVFVVSSDGAVLPPSYHPFALMRVGAYVDFADPSEVLGRPVVPTEPTSFNVVRDGLTLAEHARRTPWDGPKGPTYHVGAFVDLTTVSADGLSSRRLIEWPKDRIGERTKP